MTGSRRQRFLRRWARRWRNLNKPRWPVCAVLGVASLFSAAAGVLYVQGTYIRSDLLAARSALSAARSAVVAGHVAAARDQTQYAIARTDSADERVRNALISAMRVVPFIGPQVRGTQAMAAAARETALAVKDIVDGAAVAPVIADRHALRLSGTDLAPLLKGIEPALPDLRRANSRLARARAALKRSPATGLIPKLAQARREMSAQLDSASLQVEVTLGLTGVGRKLLAPGRVTRLLLLSQDTWELRPTGGYIGSYGILEISQKGLHLVRYDDATELPTPVGGPQPTEPLRSALDGPWVLTGAGWWPDFPRSARAAQQIFLSQGGEKVDGVLAITNTFLEDLLRGLGGAVVVPGYPDVLTPDNVSDRILHHVELKRPLDTPRKKFLIKLTDVIFASLEHFEPRQSSQIAAAIGHAFLVRHAQIYFNDPGIHAPFARAGWDGAMTAPSRPADYFSVADANFGSDKANRWVHKVIRYHVFRDPFGRLTAKVRVSTTDDGSKSPINNLYASYLRVYARPEARFEGDRLETFLTHVDSEDGFRTFGQHQVIPPGTTKERSWTYLLPATVIRDGRYRLMVRPQAGTPRDVYEITIDLGPTPVVKTFHGDDGDQIIETPAPAPHGDSLIARVWHAWRGALRR